MSLADFDPDETPELPRYDTRSLPSTRQNSPELDVDEDSLEEDSLNGIQMSSELLDTELAPQIAAENSIVRC